MRQTPQDETCKEPSGKKSSLVKLNDYHIFPMSSPLNETAIHTQQKAKIKLGLFA